MLPTKYRDLIDEVIAVDRLTEIVAMVGFTRLQGWDGKLDSPCLAPIFSYAKDYNTCIQEAKQRIGNAPIKEKLTDISTYDTIFVMSPIYWGTYAPEMETALTGLDFAGKTVRVISTHEGSGLASMVSDVKRLCAGADVQRNGLVIKGSQAKKSKQKVADWL